LVLLTQTAYSLAKVKKFMGSEGPGFNADLLHNGKTVAQIVAAGDGGETRYYFSDRMEEKAFRETVGKDADLFVENLVNRMDDLKVKARYAKKGFPITLLGHKGQKFAEGMWSDDFYIAVKTEDGIEAAVKKYGAKEWERI
jgi:hypothetical protein